MSLEFRCPAKIMSCPSFAEEFRSLLKEVALINIQDGKFVLELCLSAQTALNPVWVVMSLALSSNSRGGGGLHTK